MGQFAANTDVPVEQSKAEIERTVTRYGATSFASGWKGSAATIAFEINNRRIRFNLPLPDPSDPKFTHREVRQNATKTVTKELTPEQARKAWEQACRQKFRALALAVKAKLEAVESQISTFDQEFMAHIVMSNGQTIGEHILPRLTTVVETCKLPPLLT